jgi:hypothetical protein
MVGRFHFVLVLDLESISRIVGFLGDGFNHCCFLYLHDFLLPDLVLAPADLDDDDHDHHDEDEGHRDGDAQNEGQVD